VNTPSLIIFIDALPFHEGAVLAKRLSATTYKKMIPGVGYSINVKAELFAGLQPDQVGFFCEWNYKQDATWLKKWEPVLKLIDMLIPRYSIPDRIVRRVLGKFIGKKIFAIPYGLLPLLEHAGETAYEYEFPHETILSKNKFERLLYSQHGVDDQKLFRLAQEKIRQENTERLFVGTAELDGIMHHYGMDSPQYSRQIELINTEVAVVVEEFLKKHPNGNYFVFSDHGMARVDKAVTYEIEKLFGKAGKGSYVYSVDATFFRIWILDKTLAEPIARSMAEIEDGHILSDQERILLGIVDKAAHGDIIFLLNEGCQFSPSFYGKNISRAMHGYDPELESQKGTLLSNRYCDEREEITALELNGWMAKCLNG
jgi:hypothetical protein